MRDREDSHSRKSEYGSGEDGNPTAANEARRGARGIGPSVAELSARRFHAKYPLQVKARHARAAAPEPKTPPEPEIPTAEETAAADAPPMEAGTK